MVVKMAILKKFEDLVGKILSNVEKVTDGYQDELIFTLDNGDQYKCSDDCYK